MRSAISSNGTWPSFRVVRASPPAGDVLRVSTSYPPKIPLES